MSPVNYNINVFNLCRAIGGEIHQDGDFYLFEGNRFRQGFLYKNMAISALVSLLLAKKRVVSCFCISLNSPAILFRTRTIASAFQSEARVRCTLRPDDT